MGIKVFEFLRRNPGTTPEQFHSDWRDVYGPMLTNDPDLRRHVKRYELNHRLRSDADRRRTRRRGPRRRVGRRCGALVRLDGGDARAQRRAGAWRAIRERAPELHQAERLIVVTEDPEIIVSTPRRDEAGAKMLCILRRNAALDLDTFHHHWLTHHGGLFQNIPELREPAPGLRPEPRSARP